MNGDEKFVIARTDKKYTIKTMEKYLAEKEAGVIFVGEVRAFYLFESAVIVASAWNKRLKSE